MIRRAFDLREHDNGRLEARYFTYNSNGDLESQEDIPTATLPGRVTELFFAPPDELPAEHLGKPSSTVDVEDADKSGKVLSGHLPEGFPGKAALEEAGHNTYHKVRGFIKAGTLLEVDNIGPETATKIEAALE